VLLGGDRPVNEWVAPAPNAGDFNVPQAGRLPDAPTKPVDVSLTPFYRTHRRTYSVYFDVLTPAELDARAASIAAERERVHQMELATVGVVQPGEMQPERDYNYQSDPADRPVGRTNGRGNRGGMGWFAFDMPIDPATSMALVVTYLNEVGLPPTLGNFQVVVDGTLIATFAPNAVASGFYDARYVIPPDLTRGRSKVTVRFQAAPGGRIASVFGVRTVRAPGG
jgi:hypothetical protein